MKNITIKKIIYILLCIIWMITIFCFSNQDGESSTSVSNIIVNTIVKVAKKVDMIVDGELSTSLYSIENYQLLQIIIRKLAHFSIYLLGGIIALNTFRIFNINLKKSVLSASILCIIYSITDEIHQLFTYNRTAKVIDVLIDSSGVLVGIAIVLIYLKIKEKRNIKQ